uniref:Uncharacterized protein n=1 Tax=Megaselia scalaris TaxID=36166 RepID=T1GU31_MEGSC
MVRSIKRVLHFSLKDRPVKEIAMNIAMNIVHYRPLSQVSAFEEKPLTPNHFLIRVSNRIQTPLESDGIRRKSYPKHVKHILEKMDWRVLAYVGKADIY